MCTILYLYGIHPAFPLIVAANRDEQHARPSQQPGWLPGEPSVLAGLDLQAGGTWLGATAQGLMVGLTNQRTYALPDPALRSRGEVVLQALRTRDARELHAQLRQLRPQEYNPFNLLFGDAGGLWVAYSRPERAEIEVEPAPVGVHVLPNDRIGAPGFPKAQRALELLGAGSALRELSWAVLSQRLASVLADHCLPELARVPVPPAHSFFDHDAARRLQAICLHGEGYGTRCASIIALRPGELAHYLHAAGPPCRADFVELAQRSD